MNYYNFCIQGFIASAEEGATATWEIKLAKTVCNFLGDFDNDTIQDVGRRGFDGFLKQF